MVYVVVLFVALVVLFKTTVIRREPMRVFILALLLSICQFAFADCIRDIAKQNGLNEMDLRAIIKVESTGNPKAVHHDRNGSVSYGLMQINSIHLPELRKKKVYAKDLFKACTNVQFGATLLSRNLQRSGNMDRAIAMYNPGDPRYVRKVRQAASKIRQEQVLVRFAKSQPIEVADN